eukprot:GHVU01224217.1.p1 GENE.GHVU01224217.1~~GHVU01224217.1.p1  ORF type:complete len:356 (+),score=40.08 GHVU01224217.1:116-1183(+)
MAAATAGSRHAMAARWRMAWLPRGHVTETVSYQVAGGDATVKQHRQAAKSKDSSNVANLMSTYAESATGDTQGGILESQGLGLDAGSSSTLLEIADPKLHDCSQMGVMSLRQFCKRFAIPGVTVGGKKRQLADLREHVGRWQRGELELSAAITHATSPSSSAMPAVQRGPVDAVSDVHIRLINALFHDDNRADLVMTYAKPTSAAFAQKETGPNAPVWGRVAAAVNSSAPNDELDTLRPRVKEIGQHAFYSQTIMRLGPLLRPHWTPKELHATFKTLISSFRPLYHNFDKSGHHDQGEDSFADFISPSQVTHIPQTTYTTSPDTTDSTTFSFYPTVPRRRLGCSTSSNGLWTFQS